MLYYHHRSILPRDKVRQQSNTSQVIGSNSSKCYFGDVFIALAIGLLNGIYFSYPTKLECLTQFVEASLGRCSSKKAFLKLSQISQKTSLLESNFSKVAGLICCNIIKKRLQHRCFQHRCGINRIPPVAASAFIRSIHVL